MAIFTLAEIDEQITAYKAAMLAIAGGRSYSIAGRSLERVDLPEIRNQLEWLNSEKTKLENSAGSGPRFIPARPAR